jgi:enoyl-CoA hydratase
MPAQAQPSEATPPVVTFDRGKALITLNRPGAHNRLEPDDLAALCEAFARVDADPSLRVLILTGTGDSFSSGYHIGALAERLGRDERNEAERDQFATTVDRLEALKIPTIAALNGSVYGGATDLALACDFRIGVEGMHLLMPAARLGIVYYASGLKRYVNRLGVGAAKRLFLTAAPVHAEELLRLGYLDELVAPEQLMSRAEALAASLAQNAPLALAGLKAAINAVAADTLDLEWLAETRARCNASEDHAEALRAWSEKRPPVFTGR